MRRILLCAAVLLGSCGENPASVPVEARPTRFVATFANTDGISVAYALRLLAHHGIRADALGSFSHSIRVDESRAEEAIRLLNGVPDLRPYVSGTRISDFPAWKWENDVILGADIQEALEEHDATSALGRILRMAVKRSPPTLLVRYPVVDRVKWRTREFVHRDMTPASAIDALVLFTREKGGVRPRHMRVCVLPQD